MPPLSVAAPVARLEARQQVALCGQFSSWSGDGYELNNNLWGQSRATSGSQCTYLDGSSSSSVQWHTTWTWEGGEGQVKSYAYSGRQVTRGQTISSIKSMETSVSWEYNTTDVQANVAYDIFTAENPDHATSSGDYEVMIWLARYNHVSPIGSSMTTATNTINDFGGDTKEFFDYLRQNLDFPDEAQHLLVSKFSASVG
ncbi:hypothetical protein VTK26DRAFT_3986 [Humicola hyalothermophila]